MENGSCTKHFPKPFSRRTIVDEETSHPLYQRHSQEEDGGSVVKDGKNIDNSVVVPYNPFLSLRYNCHINVEICISPLASKYLYKYVIKGPDRAMVSADVIGNDTAPVRDAIQDYEDMYSIGSSECLLGTLFIFNC